MTPAKFIFFLSDNYNRQIAGCYGHPIVRTPTLDRLAAHGVRFANRYCASTLCVPSRGSLATGRYVHQNGCWDNAIAFEAKLRGICDPEEIDRRAKAGQRRLAEAWGGPDKLRGEETPIFSPPPGVSKEDAWRIPARG
jgi:hypothetical protein